ncbi:MAG: thioredoxin family protein [Gammaproteobacteria bacterium]|nr:thioredoxin family protein [Gammaproteobacteria bacterium]
MVEKSLASAHLKSDGVIVVVKKDCPTCVLIEPVLRQIAGKADVSIYCQDDSAWPHGLEVMDDEDLAVSWSLSLETVPAVVQLKAGQEIDRLYGWDKKAWETLFQTAFSGMDTKFRPGCASKTLDPGMPDRLALKYGDGVFASRVIEIGSDEDEMEACFDRGWSDGLPLVPPTEIRVLRMLSGTTREPHDIIGKVPPDYADCTIEKIAVNAVMAGCKPEYLPVVIASVEGALEDEFCMHGLLATTYFSGPMIIVNGPMAKAIGMNARGNALGQGNRANATIGRALQLVIRNVGGGKPQGVDRAALGNPGKYTFCFAEDEAGSCWESYAEEQGYRKDQSTVTLFAADGVQGIVDQKSRTPDSLCRSFAAGLRVASHPKMVMAADAFLVVSPEHERVFRAAGWSKAAVKERLEALLQIPGKELVRGAGGIEEGLPEKMADGIYPKFRPGGLNIVRAGGSAGLFSAIIAGWGASGKTGSVPVTREIKQ